MVVIEHTSELKVLLEGHSAKNRSIGFVPTMGALHEGHLSLVQTALSSNELVVVSIFINPTQFDNSDDLARYPQNLANDIQLLKNMDGNIIVFKPTKHSIYDGKVVSKTYNFNGLEKVMEGSFRTGHFNGVATIVELLLKAVAPDRAYFGEKDFQQLQIIKKLVTLKEIPCKIIGCPIARENNGLARSSRNERLSPEIRQKAGFIYEMLQAAKSKFGTESALEVKDWFSKEFSKTADFDLEYFEIADTDTLTPAQKIQENRTYRAFVAVYAEEVRLIDNIALN